MGLKKKKKSGSSKKAKGSSKKERKAPKEKKPSRKSFILEVIEGAGRKGISTAALIKRTDSQFDYAEGKSRMRVNNTIREAKDSGSVKVNDDGVIIWK